MDLTIVNPPTFYLSGRIKSKLILEFKAISACCSQANTFAAAIQKAAIFESLRQL